MSLYDQADGVDAGATGTDRDEPLPEGDYPELAILSIGEFRGSVDKAKLYYKARIAVLSGPHKGLIGSYIEQLEGTIYPSHAVEALARVKKFTGQLFGLTEIEQINAQVKGAVIRGTFASDGKIMAGTVFGATVSHKKTKAGKLISKYDTRAVIGADGKAKQADVSALLASEAATEAKFQKPTAPAPAAAPPPAAPAFAPPPAPAAAPVWPPLGWTEHASAPGQWYKAGMAQCIGEPELRTLVATGRA